MRAWSLDDLVDDTALCATELATNALLHSGAPFTVTLRRARNGVRVEVIDGRPTRLPVVVPLTAALGDVTIASTTGRGLRIVSSLAARWGFTTTDTTKAVWAELPNESGAASGPVVVLAHRADPPSAAPTIRVVFTSLPVRPAVASGVQVDELVREVQLSTVASAERDRLDELVEASAHPRLTGRYAALEAAAGGRHRFDVDLVTTADALEALGQLRVVLTAMAARLDPSIARISPTVEEFRSWLSQEAARQLAGRAPTECPLPE
jgi:hypothetical protein